MKTTSLFILLPLLLACAPQSEQAAESQAVPAAAAESHAAAVATHEAHAPAPVNPASRESGVPAKPLPAGGWTSDAPLREGMGRIRFSVEALGHYEQGHMGAEQAVEMAGNVERDVSFLIANCTLEPSADAALHGIILKLLKGAHALKANPADLAAIAPMREGLAEYARIFDDPAFRTQAAKP